MDEMRDQAPYLAILGVLDASDQQLELILEVVGRHVEAVLMDRIQDDG